jgi:release factor glutamine methyltransferase
MTIREWLREAEARLAGTGIESPKLEAQQLAGHVLRVDRAWLLAHSDEPFNDLAGEQVLQRRLAGEPLAYILGWREFYGRSFGVDPSVLIPRHETETLVEAALLIGPTSGKWSVLDIGTGSGILAVTLKLERPEWEVTALDISPEAISTASANARLLGAKVRLMVSDLFAAVLGESFDMIVANPPYIASSEVLPREVGDHEPGLALFAADEGLEFYRRLARDAQAYLHDHGQMILEVGHTQAEQVQSILKDAGWSQIEIRKDMSGVERVVIATFESEYELSNPV